MAITVRTLKDQYTLRKYDLNDVTDPLFIQWSDEIQKFLYERVIGADPARFITSTTYSVSTSPSTQLQPADFMTIEQFGCGLFYRNSDGTDTEIMLTETGFGSQRPGYYFSGGNIVFTGITSPQTIVLRYIPKVATIDSLDDSFFIEDVYAQDLQDTIDVRYEIWNQDPNAEYLADQRFVRALSRILSTYSPTPKTYSTGFDVTFY